MLARSSAAILVFELALYLALAAWLIAARGWSTGTAGALAVAAALALRWSIVFTTFLTAWQWRTPREAGQQIGLWATGRLIWREGMATFWVFNVLQPLAGWVMPAEKPRAGSRTVVLVHGYCCNRAAWWWLARRLCGADWNVATLNLEPVFADIEDLAKQLGVRVEQACAAAGVERVALVTHSMGGLVARAYLRRVGAHRVDRLITLGAPHGGTRIAAWGAGRNARQMEVGSRWLQSLAAVTMPAGRPVVSIYSMHDNFVAPQSNQALAGARNIAVKGVGHLELLRDEKVAALVMRALEPG
jgi:triacylglycerol esterase/lipase EstA (alpha/beta hydrolase family)